MVHSVGGYVDLKGKTIEEIHCDLKEYLRIKLTLVKSGAGIERYSCNHENHHWSDRGWKPFKHLTAYCKAKDLSWMAIWDVLEEHLDRKIVCECEIVNDVDALRRARLRRFGFDVDSLSE